MKFSTLKRADPPEIISKLPGYFLRRPASVSSTTRIRPSLCTRGFESYYMHSGHDYKGQIVQKTGGISLSLS